MPVWYYCPHCFHPNERSLSRHKRIVCDKCKKSFSSIGVDTFSKYYLVPEIEELVSDNDTFYAKE